MKRDCYVQWQLAERSGDEKTAKILKQLYVELVLKQQIVLEMPIYKN